MIPLKQKKRFEKPDSDEEVKGNIESTNMVSYKSNILGE
jgi:hypothetical protein